MAKIIVLGSHSDSLLLFRKEMLIALARNNQVIACVPNAKPNVIHELSKLGIKYQHVNLARTGLNPFADLLTIYKLYALFKKVKPDQVFSYTSKPVIFGSIAAKLAGVPQIYSMITGLGTYFIYTNFKATIVRTIMRLLYKFALKFNTKVFFQNPDDRDTFVKMRIFSDPPRTVMINGSGVNLEHFKFVTVPKTSVTFILVARLIRDKGILEYLQAAKMLQKEYPYCKFLLVGWFDNKQQVISSATLRPYIATGVIEFLGELQDVRPALARSAVFVLPSYREGTPKGVLEAMATGRAIITTDVPGCRETVLVGENGFLVPARDPLALKLAMEEFVKNPELITVMGQRSRSIAEQKFDVHAVNRTILAAMEQQYA